MPRWATLSAAAALMTALALGCRAGPKDCDHESTERCLWERGVAPPIVGEKPVDVDSGGEVGDASETNQPVEFERTLAEMVEIIGAGVEWSYVDERARLLCDDLPGPSEQPASLPPATAEAWTCKVSELEMGQQTFDLEASDGVLSLSAIDIGEAQSSDLFEFARGRFDGWCADRTFKPYEGDALALYYRCSLPEGPYLVIARFPRDLEAGRWQVSIAIVDAG